MKTHLKFAGMTAALAAALPAFAEVKLNDNFSISGYAVGAYTYVDVDRTGDDETFLDSGASNFDSAKLSLLGKAGKFSGHVSAFYIPEVAGDDLGILDAYATYTEGSFSLTGGKFLSWLGYEAFDPINMTQLTYGATIFAIPAYHTGVKFDVSKETYSFGVAAVDSVNPDEGFFQGDGEFSDDVGFEAYFTYKGIKDLTVFTGVAFESTAGRSANDLFVFDLWASYKLSDEVTIAGEVDYSQDVGTGWLALIQYNFAPKFSVIGRLSGVDKEDGTDSVGVTFAPTYTVNENLSFRAEFTQTSTDSTDSTFWGVQAVVKF